MTMAPITPTTTWTGSTTTGGAGCELRYVATLQASCTGGQKPIRPFETVCGRKRISLLTFLPARNILLLTPCALSSATIGCLRGMLLSYADWKWQDCGRLKWI